MDDASLLSILLFLSLNIAGCVHCGKVRSSFWATSGCLVVGGWFVGSIYWSAFDRAMSGTPGLTGRIFDWLWILLIAPVLGIDTNNGIYPEGSAPKVLAASLVVLAIGLMSFLVAATVVTRRLDVHVDTRALLRSLTRIVAGVVILARLSWGYDLAEQLWGSQSFIAARLTAKIDCRAARDACHVGFAPKIYRQDELPHFALGPISDVSARSNSQVELSQPTCHVRLCCVMKIGHSLHRLPLHKAVTPNINPFLITPAEF